MMGNDDLLACDRMAPLLMASGSADPQKSVMAEIRITWSEVSLGVPRSPNRDLEELRVFRQIDVSRCQVEFYSLSDIGCCIRLGFPGRGTAWKLRAHGRVIAGLGIMFQDDPECHIHSIVPRMEAPPGTSGQPVKCKVRQRNRVDQRAMESSRLGAEGSMTADRLGTNLMDRPGRRNGSSSLGRPGGMVVWGRLEV